MNTFIQKNIGSQVLLLDALKQNMYWVKNSFKVNNNLGSSKYKTSWGRWASDYPETTGYLIPTLINSSELLKDKSLHTLAEQQVTYFKSLQLCSGGFAIEKGNAKSYVFDSAQILIGLINLYNSNKNNDILLMIKHCYSWLINSLNNNGKFESSNYKNNYNPSYYSRIVWSFFNAESILNVKSEKSLTLYHHMKSLLNTNGTFNDCSFDGSSFAFTHNLIYSYRGLWESAIEIDDNSFMVVLKNHLLSITQKIIKDRHFNGEYNNEWKTQSRFICTTGNAQLVTLLLSVFGTEYEDILKACQILINPLLNQQKKMTLFNKGAIPSSIPVWEKYQRFRYTNWTQKFYSDALIKLLTT